MWLPAAVSRFQMRGRPNRDPGGRPAAEKRDMQDFYWIALVLGLLAATIGYAALCDRA
jgi:hypothetical protein